MVPYMHAKDVEIMLFKLLSSIWESPLNKDRREVDLWLQVVALDVYIKKCSSFLPS